MSRLQNYTSAILLSAVATLVLTGSASADVNLIQNGGFETGDFTDWALSGNTGSTFVSSGPNAPHSGSYAAQLGAVGTDDLMTQTISDTAGSAYTLSFWHIYTPTAGPTGDFSVQWDGSTIYGPIASTSPPSPQVWTQYSFTVDGTGSDTLTFVSRNDPSYQGLDDISLTLGGSSAPAPTPGVGFLSLSLLMAAAAIVKVRAARAS